MLLAIDVGNTNTVFAVFKGERVVAQWRLMTESRRTGDEYAATLSELMRNAGIAKKDIVAVVASFVVPRAVFPIKTLCRDYFGVEPMIVGAPNVKTGVKVLLDNPKEVGADILVNTVGAWKRHKKPMIVVDFGTATTFQTIDGKGNFMGGCIAPGINLSLEALYRAAAALPAVDVRDPGKVIGTNTVSAMESGIFYGYVGLIEGIVKRIKKEYGAKMLVLATGGLAPLFEKATGAIDHVEHDLTIFGLNEIYKMNVKKK